MRKKSLNKSFNKTLKIISGSFLYLFLAAFCYSSVFIGINFSRVDTALFLVHSPIIFSEIRDGDGELVTKINETHANPVNYNSLPTHLIEALLSVEDNGFFSHNGIELKRIAASLFSNIKDGSYSQGASTITQQLAKNLFLTSDKTFERKVQEVLLAIRIENTYSKEEILEEYFNAIYFEPTIPGVSYAAYRYFNKNISQLTLLDSALLAGLVKSPSIYNPQRNPKNCFARRNLVLKTMLENNYLSSSEYENFIKVPIEEQVIIKGSNYEEVHFEYQSYLDAVIEETAAITSSSPYARPLIINTYLNREVQGYIDDMQNGLNFKFNDNDDMQFAVSLFDNDTAGVIALAGGRNYQGQLLYNRATNMRRNPASTIKPLLSYALAVEFLDYNAATTVVDEETFYPHSSTRVNNVDDRYLGPLTVLEALGMSRNTTAIQTLARVNQKIGTEQIVNYLNDIGIMDDGEFNFSYGLGGMSNGVSPFNMSAAYAVLANGGKYNKPTVIKSIYDKETGELLYAHDTSNPKQVLSEGTAFTITDILTQAVGRGYNGLSQARPNDVILAAKTGTGAYDRATINKFNFPSNADKDIWLNGYTKDYSLSVWTGYDLPSKEKKSYFASGDSSRRMAKSIFNKIMSLVAKKNNSFPLSSELRKVELVKHLDKDYLNNGLIPQSLTQIAYVKKDAYLETLPFPSFNQLNPPLVIEFDDKYEIILPVPIDKSAYGYAKLFGELGYEVIVTKNSESEKTFHPPGNIIIEKSEDITSISIQVRYPQLLTTGSNIYFILR